MCFRYNLFILFIGKKVLFMANEDFQMNTHSNLTEDTQLRNTTMCNYFDENKYMQIEIFVLVNFGYFFFPGLGLEGTTTPGDRLGQSGQCQSNKQLRFSVNIALLTNYIIRSLLVHLSVLSF